MEEDVALTENLLVQIEQMRSRVNELAELRRQAFSCEGHAYGTHLLVCWGYHSRFTAWREGQAHLLDLERQLQETQGAQP
jgi:hypothetical protein